MPTVDFADLLIAYEFASAEDFDESAAYVCRETGAIFIISDAMDPEEPLPDDLETSSRYLAVPGKRDLDLGKPLVLRFTAQEMPDRWDEVDGIFRSKGAYGRFRTLLERSGLQERWYKYQDDETPAALRQWCEDNDLQASS